MCVCPLPSPLGQVDFDGPYPVEGAKEVATLMTRYVSSALRRWERSNAERLAVQRGGNATLWVAPPLEHGTELTLADIHAQQAAVAG